MTAIVDLHTDGGRVFLERSEKSHCEYVVWGYEENWRFNSLEKEGKREKREEGKFSGGRLSFFFFGGDFSYEMSQ